MRPEAKHRRRIVEEAVDRILRPLGFAKKKLIWRRRIREVLQQFSIATPFGESYRIYWGLNILSRCEDPAPLAWKLNAMWHIEMMEKHLPRRLEYLDCFDFGVDMPLEKREERVTELMQKYVIAVFEMYKTEDSVRRMMGDRKAPLRAQSYGGLPDEWWPGGGRAKGSGAPPVRVIRPWKPPGDLPGEP